MNDDEVKAFIGSDMQRFMVKNQKMRMAEFFLNFLQASPDQLPALQAQAAAHYRILREISLDDQDLLRLSQEAVEQMEEQRKVAEKALERHMQESRDRVTRGSFPTL